MWAMIGTSIALTAWTTVLLVWTVRVDKTRVVDGTGSESGHKQEGSVVEKDKELVEGKV